MSRARKIPKDLHTVATLAGTTAAVVEGAAIAAEKAQKAADAAAEVKEQVVAQASKKRGKGLVVLLVLGLLALVGIVIWKKSSGGGQDAEVTDLRTGASEFAGSMP